MVLPKKKRSEFPILYNTSKNNNIVVPMFSNYKGLCSNYQMCEYLKLSTVYCEIAVQVAN